MGIAHSSSPTRLAARYIGGNFLYALRADTSDGFELCPADACEVVPEAPKFTIDPDFDHPLVAKYQRFLKSHSIHVAGVEFIVDETETDYTYDINTNTNHNAGAEALVSINGMRALARYLGAELSRLTIAAENRCDALASRAVYLPKRSAHCLWRDQRLVFVRPARAGAHDDPKHERPQASQKIYRYSSRGASRRSL